MSNIFDMPLFVLAADRDGDLPEMLAGLHVFEGLLGLRPRIDLVDDRLGSVLAHRAVHVLEGFARANRETLDARIVADEHARQHRHAFAAEAGDDTDDRYVALLTHSLHRFHHRVRAADFDDEIDAAASGELAR